MEFEIFNPCGDGKHPHGAVPAGVPAVFSVRPGRGLCVSRVGMNVKGVSGGTWKIEMTDRGTEKLCEVFSCEFTPPQPGMYRYAFELDTMLGPMFVCPGPGGEGRLCTSAEESWQLSVFAPGFQTPGWIKGGVIYQIFPDRFFKEGDFPENLPAGRVLREDWGGTPEYRPDENGKIRNNDYFGGNLRGMIQKLPYLRSLGVTALYLNPVFEAHSNHRYNTGNYKKIDPMLGSREDFEALCDEAGRQGMRVILDGVFNHTGDDSVYFNRYGRYPETGAYASRESKWFRWYDFTAWPEKYRCWWGIPSLPAVNKSEPSFLAYITGNDGVLEHWMEAGACGWRLDVADELPTPFLEEIRKTVKRENPEALLIGEVWEDASNKVSYGEVRHYFEGAELDGVMNYPFRNAVIEFLREGVAEKLNDTLLALLDHYPKQCTDVLMNLLGTHDTPRLITVLAGENADAESREWKAGSRLGKEARKRGVRLVKLASALQFFLPGVPCVYYGDEAGLEGYEDPFNRRCFPWGKEDRELVAWYRLLGKLRAACPALAEGEYVPLAAQDGLFAFMRTDGRHAAVCAVNAGNRPAPLLLPAAAAVRPAAGVPAVPEPGESAVIAPLGCGIWIG